LRQASCGRYLKMHGQRLVARPQRSKVPWHRKPYTKFWSQHQISSFSSLQHLYLQETST
jgi:hypothetical protein